MAVQVPIYEYLPAIGSLLALLLIGKELPWRKPQVETVLEEGQSIPETEESETSEQPAIIDNEAGRETPGAFLAGFLDNHQHCGIFRCR